ncbi:MAG: hypothetical protein ACK4IT_09730 [Thioalkalivibrionaceae bacterium]
MMGKSLQDMSAEELFALARLKQQEEQDKREKALRAQIRQLQDKRKALEGDYRQALAEIDRQIAELSGSKSRPRRRGSSRMRTGTASEKICEIVGSKPEMTVEEIRIEADKAGINTKNLSQSLAYLKKQGRLESLRRGVYSIVR